MRNKTKTFKHLTYGELDVRWLDKDSIYFKEFQVYAIIFNADEDSLMNLEQMDEYGSITINVNVEHDYNHIKHLFQDIIINEAVKKDLLKWIKSIKKDIEDIESKKHNRSKKKSDTKEAVSSVCKQLDKYYRISDIGKMYDISAKKLNLILQLEDILIKTKDGYELAEEYEYIGKRILVDIKNEDGEIYKKKNYVVYTEEGKELIEELIEKYIEI